MRIRTRTAAALSAVLLVASAACGDTADGNREKRWSAVTIASNGAWGVSTSWHKASARLAAIRDCRVRSGSSTEDCGERTVTVLGGWTLAFACGERTFVVAEPTLEEARVYARYRETEMRFAQSSGLGMPKCRLVVSVDPNGAISFNGGM
jgi:hypothetical protein